MQQLLNSLEGRKIQFLEAPIKITTEKDSKWYISRRYLVFFVLVVKQLDFEKVQTSILKKANYLMIK